MDYLYQKYCSIITNEAKKSEIYQYRITTS